MCRWHAVDIVKKFDPHIKKVAILLKTSVPVFTNIIANIWLSMASFACEFMTS